MKLAKLSMLAVLLMVGCTPATPEELAAEAQEDIKREARNAMGMMIAIGQDAVVQSLRDPGSVEWKEKYVNTDTGALCYSFRAKNGFGGFGDDGMVIHEGKLITSVDGWNAHCADKDATYEYFY